MPPVRQTLLLLVILLLGTAPAQQAPPAPPADTDAGIVVVGRGVAFGEPDLALLELGVTAQHRDVRQAVNEIDEGIRAVMEALVALGVPERSIRSTAYNVWREERHQGAGEREGTATFRAQHMLRVELEGPRRAGEALAVAVEAGANAVGAISFAFSDPQLLESRARAEAMTDAERRAQELAQAAGLVLGPVRRIEEISASGGPQPLLERSSAMMADAAPIAPGELQVEIRIAVRYEVERSR